MRHNYETNLTYYLLFHINAMYRETFRYSFSKPHRFHSYDHLKVQPT